MPGELAPVIASGRRDESLRSLLMQSQVWEIYIDTSPVYITADLELLINPRREARLVISF